MNTFISMLRGINVSGQKKIRMVALKSLYESLDLINVRTYIQSGNVVFNSTEQNASKLSELIKTEIEQIFGVSVPVLIRNVKSFQRVIADNPFLPGRNEDLAKLYVTFLYSSPLEAKLSVLAVPDNERSEFFVEDKEIYLMCNSF